MEGPGACSLMVCPLVFALLNGSAGCSSRCTAMACSSATDIYFTEALHKPGRYQVRMETAATGIAICTATLPDARDSRCSGPGASWMMVGAKISSNSGETQGPANGVVGVSLQGEHRSLRMSVVRDGITVGDTTLLPTYTGKEINGPGCGQCWSATARVALR